LENPQTDARVLFHELSFRIVTCPACSAQALPWASGVDNDGELLWSCLACDHPLPVHAMEKATAVAPESMSDFGYLVEGHVAQTGGCGSDGGSCSSCSSKR
jgi:hypothetical protein